MEQVCDERDSARKRRRTVYHFLDYRQYLLELFSQFQEQDPDFSYRAFARLVESTSPNFLQLVRDGKLRISDRQSDALARNVAMKGKEYEYFRALIDFDHAETHFAKNSAFRRIVALRENRAVPHLTEYQYCYLADWYNPVVRELVCSDECCGNLQWVADQVVPAIGLREVKKSVQMLEELRLITPRENGKGWQASDPTVATPEEVLSVAVVEYHRQMMKRASEALELFPGDQRDIRAVTLGIPRDKFEDVKARMTEFWNELLELADSSDDAEVVVQINTQLFPLTKVEGRR